MIPEIEERIQRLKQELEQIQEIIKRKMHVCNQHPFPLVAGFGYKGWSNRKKEKEFDRSMRAPLLLDLCVREGKLKDEIKYYESGQYEKDVERRRKKEEYEDKVDLLIWDNIKPGSKIGILNNVVVVKKKSKFSIVTESNVKFTIEEIIGKKNAAIIRARYRDGN